MSDDPSPKIPAWVWIGFAVLMALCVPWYVPAGGMIEPRIWAFPLWGWVVVGGCVLLAAYTAFVYLKVWKSTDGEDGSGAGAPPEEPDA